MGVLLFSLRNVPDDEAEEVRALLEENGIAFYETSGGRWGTAVPALWLEKETELARARQLIDAYQVQRATTQREIYARLIAEGRAPRVRDMFLANPVRFVVYLAIIAVLLYFSTKPFWGLGT